MVLLPPLKISINFFFSIKVRKTLIFDLDETLIHCNELDTTPGDILFPFTFENGE
jgi:CTD small phosphatase-like protein 2